MRSEHDRLALLLQWQRSLEHLPPELRDATDQQAIFNAMRHIFSAKCAMSPLLPKALIDARANSTLSDQAQRYVVNYSALKHRASGGRKPAFFFDKQITASPCFRRGRLT